MNRYTKRTASGRVYGTGPATVCWGGRPIGERAFCVGCHGEKDNGAVDRSKCGPLAIIDRLAAYEDTGLGPEEITTEPYGCVFYCNRKCNLDGDFCAEGPGCPYEINAETAKHLLDLAQAEKDGRLVVLPCKAGDTVYSIEPLWLGAIVCEESKCRTCDRFYEGGMGDYPSCLCKEDEWCLAITEETATLRNIVNWMAGTDFGKTVFLTREEAEAALKKRGGAHNEAG